MFSVIIPLYNKAPYVEKAIRSVAAQTFREFELIVIDDGSTDNSFEIANQLIGEILIDSTTNPPLGGLRGATQLNSGVSTARNNGVALASYPYICFLDADDWWAPTFLEEMKALIEEFPEAGIYGTGYYIVKHSRIRVATIGVDDGFEKGEIDYCRVYAKTLCMPLWTGAVCIPKPVFEEENGFKPALKLGEDFDLWIRIALKHKVVLVNKPLAYYNQDVEIQNRAIGPRLYKPEEHMLFTDYGKMMENEDFKILFDKLAIYGLLPYYLNNVNAVEVKNILERIDWKNTDSEFAKYYRMPKFLTILYFRIKKKLSNIKRRLQ
ncbi:MAG: glycosyltransferase family 2 protein [Paludibacteraceae bacterium]